MAHEMSAVEAVGLRFSRAFNKLQIPHLARDDNSWDFGSLSS